eukprot:16376-Heterococcus_DN1.PRE.3
MPPLVPLVVPPRVPPSVLPSSFEGARAASLLVRRLPRCCGDAADADARLPPAEGGPLLLLRLALLLLTGRGGLPGEDVW